MRLLSQNVTQCTNVSGKQTMMLRHAWARSLSSAQLSYRAMMRGCDRQQYQLSAGALVTLWFPGRNTRQQKLQEGRLYLPLGLRVQFNVLEEDTEQKHEVAAHIASITRKQREVGCWFSTPFLLLIQPCTQACGRTTLRVVSPTSVNVETPQTHPVICLLGDSRACQVGTIPHSGRPYTGKGHSPGVRAGR